MDPDGKLSSPSMLERGKAKAKTRSVAAAPTTTSSLKTLKEDRTSTSISTSTYTNPTENDNEEQQPTPFWSIPFSTSKRRQQAEYRLDGEDDDPYDLPNSPSYIAKIYPQPGKQQHKSMVKQSFQEVVPLQSSSTLRSVTTTTTSTTAAAATTTTTTEADAADGIRNKKIHTRSTRILEPMPDPTIQEEGEEPDIENAGSTQPEVEQKQVEEVEPPTQEPEQYAMVPQPAKSGTSPIHFRQKKTTILLLAAIVAVVVVAVVVIVVGFIEPGIFTDTNEKSSSTIMNDTVAPSVVPTNAPIVPTTTPNATATNAPTTNMPSANPGTNSTVPTKPTGTPIDKPTSPPTVPTPTPVPTVESTDAPTTAADSKERAEQIIDFINENKLSPNEFEFPLENPSTQEERAVHWLIYNDPLGLTANSPNILQRYAVLSVLGGNPPTNNIGQTNDLDGRQHECLWKAFVECENFTVVSLNVSSSNNQSLRGTIPADVALISSLVSLDLTHPGIHGDIPQELWYLTSLTSLALGNENLQASIPVDFAQNLTDLVSLDLSQIRVNDNDDIGRETNLGTLPTAIWGLTKLTSLDISGMGIASGTFPNTVNQLAMLTNLNASSSKFTGTLPNDLGSWTELRVFDISSNGMIGSIPSSIAMWTLIETALFDGNNFEGSIPDSFCDISTLQEFSADCIDSVQVDNGKSNFGSVYCPPKCEELSSKDTSGR
jgi:hypothetical protein